MLFFRTEILFAYSAELAYKIFGKVFPLYAGFILIIDPAAYIAYIFHEVSPFGLL